MISVRAFLFALILTPVTLLPIKHEEKRYKRSDEGSHKRTKAHSLQSKTTFHDSPKKQYVLQKKIIRDTLTTQANKSYCSTYKSTSKVDAYESNQ